MFKPLYYLGSKANFAAPILQEINKVSDSGAICDLFAGTGAVGMALSSSRSVTTVDVQEYSRVICSAQLNPCQLSSAAIVALSKAIVESDIKKSLGWCLEPLLQFEGQAMSDIRQGDPKGMVDILESPPLISAQELEPDAFSSARKVARKRLVSEGLLAGRNSTVSSYFGGTYFSYEQAIFLDAALAQADETSELCRDTIVAATLSVASSIVNTVGKQFAQPLRAKTKSGEIKGGFANAVLRDRGENASEIFKVWISAYSKLKSTEFPHRALRSDYREALNTLGSEFSVVYADPPYTRDHYSRFYHVLETMCLRDNPSISVMRKAGMSIPSRGLYREDRHQSPFCIKSEAPKAFADLFSLAGRHNLPIVLSYSPHERGDGTHPRVVSSSDILKIAKQHYRSVEITMIDGSTHNKLNRSDLELSTRQHAEMILTCSRARSF